MAKSKDVERELTYEEEIAREEAEAAEAEAAREAATVAVSADPQAKINAGLLKVLERLADRADAHTGPTPQIPYAKYKHKTPWNPTGEKYRRPLSRPTFLNGHRLHEKQLSQEDIDLLNKVRPGVYNGRKWTVIEQSLNENGQGAIKIYIPNRTPEQRMAMMAEGRTLTELLTKIINEQGAVKAA